MQILEILVIGDQRKLFTDFSAHLPLTLVEQPDIETYRLEIDADLVLVFYCIFEEVGRSVSFLENVVSPWYDLPVSTCLANAGPYLSLWFICRFHHDDFIAK